MMGRTHAATGAAAGALIAPHIDASGVAMTALVAVSTGGYALLADLDHPNATASRLLGPITWLLSKMLRGLSSLTC